MKAIIHTLLIIIISNVSTFAQDFSPCQIQIEEIGQIDSEMVQKQLNHRTKKFSKIWAKANKPLGKDSIRKILNDVETYYIPMYETIKVNDNKVILKPARNPISDIIYIYKGIWLGSYEQVSFQLNNYYCCSKTEMSGLDYSKYTKMDTKRIADFLTTNNIFALKGVIQDYVEIGMNWYRINPHKQLEKTDKHIVQSKIFETNQ